MSISGIGDLSVFYTKQYMKRQKDSAEFLSKFSKLMKLPKKKKIRKLTKKNVWPIFSRYIRLRDCLATTGTLEWGRCVTCNKKLHFKELQAGHLIDGRTGKNFMDERGVFAQCGQCNVYLHGNKERYVPWFLDTYGKILYDELLKEKEAHNWTQSELIELKKDLLEKIEYIENL